MTSERASKRQKKANGKHGDGSDAVEASIPLAKVLASSDKRERDRGIKSLSAFLARSGNNVIPPKEMAKLWKGIFQCFYHSDKPLVQQALADELSNLILLIPSSSAAASSADENGTGTESRTESVKKAGKRKQNAAPVEKDADGLSDRAIAALAFVEGFWDSIVREWPTLDKHRVSKFYLLMRRFVNSTLRLLAIESWDKKTVERYAQIWMKEGGAMCATDPKVLDSIKYHICDVFLEELDKVATSLHQEEDGSTKQQDRTIPLLPLLKPFIHAAAHAHNPALFKRIDAEVLGPLLSDTLHLSTPTKEGKGREDDEDLKWRNIIAASCPSSPSSKEKAKEDGSVPAHAAAKIRAELIAQLYEEASTPSAALACRTKIYKMQLEERNRVEEFEEEWGRLPTDE